MKNYCKFAAYFAKVCFITFGCVVFFIATNSALYAANTGYQIPAVCYTSKVSKCTLASSGGDSLSYSNTLIFLTQMPKYEKDYSSTNNSNANVTPDCESVNSVNTVLSQRSVGSIEYLLHHFWNNFYHDDLTDNVMSMLAVYVKHCPDDASTFKKPDWMIKFVSELIQLNGWLRDIMNDERVWEWKETSEGWSLPNNL